ncbi:MAG: MscL family protein [Spirochaetia bacterium]|nr:MscL family protein [Spirochaetia bacterium]
MFVFPCGASLNAVINFLILTWVVFLSAKLILKEADASKKQQNAPSDTVAHESAILSFYRDRTELS